MLMNDNIICFKNVLTYPLFKNQSDVLHPNRANVSKDELRQKLAELYKANKDQVSCFGFRTQYGGGKSTGFALVYDSHEALKKFEPQYRLVRYGVATKTEKASRQQRMCSPMCPGFCVKRDTQRLSQETNCVYLYRQATQKQSQDCEGDGEDKRCHQEGEEIGGWRAVISLISMERIMRLASCSSRGYSWFGSAWESLSTSINPQGVET